MGLVPPGCIFILILQVSLLNEPNTSSPANVDASVMYRRWKDSRGKDKEYENIIRWTLGRSKLGVYSQCFLLPKSSWHKVVRSTPEKAREYSHTVRRGPKLHLQMHATSNNTLLYSYILLYSYNLQDPFLKFPLRYFFKSSSVIFWWSRVVIGGVFMQG